MRITAAVVVCAAVVTAIVVGAQQPATTTEPTFRSGVNYVELSVRVTDRQGNFLRDLKQSDFEIFEDGARQDISTFRLVDLPLPDPKKPVAEPASGTSASQPLILHKGDTTRGRTDR